MEREAGKAYPARTGGDGGCPPEDCSGPTGFMAGRDDMLSLHALEGTSTPWPKSSVTSLWSIGQNLLMTMKTTWRLEDAAARSRARERAQGRPPSRRDVNMRLRPGEHLERMHQQW